MVKSVYKYLTALLFASCRTSQPNAWEGLPQATSWTTRGHRCLPFSPQVRTQIFIAHSVQRSRFSAIHAGRFEWNFANCISDSSPAFQFGVHRGARTYAIELNSYTACRCNIGDAGDIPFVLGRRFTLAVSPTTTTL